MAVANMGEVINEKYFSYYAEDHLQNHHQTGLEVWEKTP